MLRDAERNVQEDYRYKVRGASGTNDCVVAGEVLLITGEMPWYIRHKTIKPLARYTL